MNSPSGLCRSSLVRNVVSSVLAASLAMFAAAAQSAEETKAEGEAEDVAELSDIEVIDDPLRTLPNEVSGSSFGFSKPLLETPRSVSFISRETIDLYGISAVEDLARLTPSVFTPSRYGIQGSIDVRGIPADTYIRGMKRVTLQGNARSVLAAMDTIEVVKGPPSPIYGMGKIGGYTNLVPKSGRAKVGGYLPNPQGYAQAIIGSLSREEFSAGVGGPMTVFGKTGGYYAYGLLEDTDAYYVGTPYDQKIVQAASSIDKGIGPFRIEVGGSYQVGDTAGSLSSRITRDYIKTGRYIAGGPLKNLDANRNGTIGWIEMNRESPVAGRLSADNQPLVQTWLWPTDANGNILPIDQIPRVAGIPQNMRTFLTNECAAGRCSPQYTALLATTGNGPLPISGSVPIGFALDPNTVRYAHLSDGERRRATAHERELKAILAYGYFDLVYDENPDFTMKNQVFVDTIDQYKASNQPLYLKQDVMVAEDKFTLTKRFNAVPPWMKLNTLGSVNVRRTTSHTVGGVGGDMSSSRLDILDPLYKDEFAGRNANNTFTSAYDYTGIAVFPNGTYEDGMPIASQGKSEFTEYGIGAMADIELFNKLNVIAGARYDYARASNTENAGTFNTNTGTSLGTPGAFRSTGSSVSGSDEGGSWSVSASYKAGAGIHPYITMAQSSVTLDGSNNRLSNGLVNLGFIGKAELKEAGVKSSMFRDKLFLTVATYEQSRINVSYEDDDTLLSADVSSTITKGTEVELKLVPIRGLNLSIFGLKQVTKFAPNLGGDLVVDARLIGFQDVLDASGKVIYPAEAFLYGGRARIRLPDNSAGYDIRPTQPEYQYGANASYQWQSGWGFTLSGNYMSDVCGGRACLVNLPSVTTANLGIFKSFGPWDLKLDITNLTNEDYYRPRQYSTNSDSLYTALPLRRYAFTAKMNFK
jgi:iron complex outermembrane receptor protein